MITEEYRKVQTELHKSDKHYGSVVKKSFIEEIKSLANTLNTQDILDYGCGKGNLAKRIGFPIKEYDPAIPEKSKRPKPADIVVCLDVLEHVEPKEVEHVLGHLSYLIKQRGYFYISTKESKRTLPTGENVHLVVKPPGWWLKKLYYFFTIIEYSPSDKGVKFLVAGR